MKQKIGVIFFIVIFAFSLMACGQKELAAEGNNPQKEEENQSETVSQEPEDTEKTEEDSPQPVKEEPSQIKEKANIIVYSKNADATGFDAQETELAELTPGNVLNELIKKGAASADTTVLNFAQVESDGKKMIDLDLSESYETFLNGQGSTGEYYAIGAICNTYLGAYGCDGIKITVNGAALSTGHAEYPGYMSTFQ